MRAERKAGEMLRKAKEVGQRATGKEAGPGRGNEKVSNETTPFSPTLAEIGITRDQSSRYQKLAAMPDEHFETAVETAKASAGEVTTAFMPTLEIEYLQNVGFGRQQKARYRAEKSTAASSGFSL